MRPLAGVDLEETGRFESLLQNEHFCRRVYTQGELEHIRASGHPAACAAGVFCAKEAAAKALCRGLFGLLPRELEVTWDDRGAPVMNLRGSAARQYPGAVLALSATHKGGLAAAVCTGFLPE